MDRVRTTYVDEYGTPMVQPVVQAGVQPVVQQPVVQQPVVQQVGVQPVVQPVVANAVVTNRIGTGETRAVFNRSVVSPASIAGGIFGALMITFGAVAAARAGFDGPIGDPVIGVFATTATAVSGVIVATLGLFMLLAALGRSREGVMFFGIVTGIAAFVVAIEPSVGGNRLGMTSSFAALLAVVSLVVVAIAAFVPTIRSTSERIQRTA